MKIPTSQPDVAAPPASESAAPPVLRGVPRMPRDIGPEEGLRFYAAILGRKPELDPEAPDLLPRWPGCDEQHNWNWHGQLRDELGRALHLPGRRRLERPPTWSELLDHMSTMASRRLAEARRRIAPAVSSAAARIASARAAASRPLAESRPATTRAIPPGPASVPADDRRTSSSPPRPARRAVTASTRTRERKAA